MLAATTASGPPSWVTYTAIAVAAYGAGLSTLLAIHQFRRERRRIHISIRPTFWVGESAEKSYEVLEVQAVNDGHRPVEIRQAGVVTIRGTIYHPSWVVLDESRKAPRLIADGESVVFHFKVESFEDSNYLPKSVWVQDYAGRHYKKRCGRKLRGQLEDLASAGETRRETAAESKA